MISIAAMVVVLVQAATTPPGDPQAKATAQALIREGTALYNAGNPAGALAKFEGAYAVFPSPKILFNVAQAQRDLGHKPEALDAFERFLRDATDAPEDTIAEAQRAVAELRAQVTPPPVPSPVSRTPIGTPAAPPRADLAAPSPGPTKSKGARQLVWITSGATAALAIGAIVMGLSATSRFNHLRDSCGQTVIGCSEAEIGDVKSEVHTTNLLWAAAGVAAVATGITFYVDRGGGWATFDLRF